LAKIYDRIFLLQPLKRLGAEDFRKGSARRAGAEEREADEMLWPPHSKKHIQGRGNTRFCNDDSSGR